MRTREKESELRNQPERARFHVSAANASSEVTRAKHFTEDLGERHLPLPPETDGSKQSVSDPSAPNPFEINSTDGMTERGLFLLSIVKRPIIQSPDHPISPWSAYN